MFLNLDLLPEVVHFETSCAHCVELVEEMKISFSAFHCTGAKCVVCCARNDMKLIVYCYIQIQARTNKHTTTLSVLNPSGIQEPGSWIGV